VKTLQRDYDSIIANALEMTRKHSENDLSIYEIINAYDKIITEEPEKLDPFNRSKIYLQLITFRQEHEAE
jgi:hypothetical protein